MQFVKSMTLAACVALIGLCSTAGAADQKFGSDRHVARGIACTVCHGQDMKNPEFPDENTCTQCHNKAQMAEKTKALKPNPHAAPHNGDCTLCHMQHEPTVNYCNQCHEFKFPAIP